MDAILEFFKNPEVQRSLIRLILLALGVGFYEGEIPTGIDGGGEPIGLVTALTGAYMSSRSPARIKAIAEDPTVKPK